MSFVFGDVNTDDYGIYVFSDRVYDAPKRDVDVVEVPGRNGALVFDNGRYEDIEMIYGCVLMSTFREQFDVFRAALMSQTGYKILTDSFHPDEYRLAYISNSLSPTNTPQFFDGTFDIEFTCKPQRFLTSGNVTETFTENGTIQNPTEYDALPLIRVYGHGSINIGTDTITITENDLPYIDIDCDMMDAVYEGVNANPYVSVSGDAFPRIHSGENGVTFDSTITQVVITPRWWTL